jgi:hypothetical protein
MWLVYGGALAAVVARAGRTETWHAVGLVAALCLAVPCLWVAVPLVWQGWASSYDRIPHVTGNHKALAVALAPWLPLLWAGRRPGRWWVDAVLAVSLVAIGLSFSKNAWMTAAFGLLCLAPVRGRPLAARPGLALGAAGALALVMVALPFVTGNALMRDAFDARMSLNLRAWQMFGVHPIVGAGPGISTVWLMFGAPHQRINHVEAHGVIQKVAGEGGLLGLATYGFFVAWLLARLWRLGFAAGSRATRLEAGACAAGLALFVNLLLSTEAFTSSHWAPLGLVLGIAQASARRDPAG